MVEVTGNLWTYPAAWRVITTNGYVKKNGEGVMGRGCAKEASQRYPGLAKELGNHIKANGNVLGVAYPYSLIFFPVKHEWFDEADPLLIGQSVRQLQDLIQRDPFKGKAIVMPRPGCGNGLLLWEDVRPLLLDLPDTVRVITFR